MPTRLRPALVTSCAVAVLAGCGGSSTPAHNGEASKPAAQIVRDAGAALTGVRSVRLQGTVTIARHPTAVNVALQPPSTANVAFAQGSASAALILLGPAVYIKANSTFYQQNGGLPPAAAKLIVDRWLKLPAAAVRGTAGLIKGLDVATLGRCLGENPDRGTLSVAGTTTVDGRPAVVVLDHGDRPGSTPSKLYVASTGTPFPLRAVATGAQRPGGHPDPQCNSGGDPTASGDQLTFSGYNQTLNITAPPNAVDATTLGRR